MYSVLEGVEKGFFTSVHRVIGMNLCKAPLAYAEVQSEIVKAEDFTLSFLFFPSSGKAMRLHSEEESCV